MNAQILKAESTCAVSPKAHLLWERYMRAYDYLNSVESYGRSLRDIADSINSQAGMKILDAGSGTGNLSELLASRGATVVSCDNSNSALKEHRAKNPKATIIQASLEDPLPLESQTFDAICCASVLFTLSRKGSWLAMNEFQRLLRPGGQIVVTVATPTNSNLTLLIKHLKSTFEKSGWSAFIMNLLRTPTLLKILYYNNALQQLPDWQGYHRFSEAELRDLAAEAGFTGIEVTKTYGGGFFLLKAFKPGN